MLDDKLHKKLTFRQENNALRELISHPSMIDFSSNDYLGFAKMKWSNTSSSGSTGSRLISGHSTLYEATEQKIADFHHSESALIFNSGYTANLGLLSCLPQKEDTVIYDQLCHASIRDGLKMTLARNFSFKHNDTHDLTKKIQQATGIVYVVVESIYSMDGDSAPLEEINRICKQYNAKLIIDEAHAIGVFGSMGEGLAHELDCFAKMYGFGKAMGSHGAAIVGSQLLIDYLVNFSRPFIYTTALPPHSIERINWAYDSVKNTTQRKDLQTNISHFKAYCKHPGLILSQSAIQCIVMGGTDKTKALSHHIQNHGFDVRPILHPTVEQSKERIRICIHSFNTEDEIYALCQLINQTT